MVQVIRYLIGSLFGFGAAASAQPYYSLTFLNPLPGHSSLSMNAINNRGEVVGVSYGSPISNQTPYLYRPGFGMQALPRPSGHQFSVPTDINDHGMIVGYAQPTWLAEQSMVAWTLADGEFVNVFPGVSYGNNINNHGTIVGRACLSGVNLTCYFMAEPGGAMQVIGPANFYSSSTWRFVDINDAGQVCYTAPAPGLAQFREPDGTLTPLTAPTPPFVRTFTWAINNAGQVAARWEYNIGSQYFSRAFIWSAGRGAMEIGVPANHVRPKGMNNLGHVVGESGPNQGDVSDVWLWTPGRGNVSLDDLIDPAHQIVVDGVSGINDAGQIIARGTQLAPVVRSVFFIMTPPGAPCDPDVNCDGSADGFDVEAMEQAVGGDLENFCQPDADFNHDGSVDGFDVESLENTVAGGTCP
jgi:hypothetical protein